MKPKNAVIYLSYNARPYLKDVVLSLEHSSYPKELIELIIVDNASSDNSAELIREMVLPKAGTTLPKITFFPQETNKGFAAGNNIGIEHALLNGAQYIFLLNNDARLHPHALDEAVTTAESDKTIGSVQSLMLLWQDENIINSTGGMVHFLGFGYVRDNGKKMKVSTPARVAVNGGPPTARNEVSTGGGVDGQDPGLVRNGSEIFYASGAAVLYRASALRLVGVLDPYLFLYHEDLELGWRLRLAGFKNVIATGSVVYHHYEFKRSIQKFYWMERNRVLVHASHLKRQTLLILFPFLLVLEIALFVASFKGGWTKEKLFVYFDFLRPKTWLYIKRKRNESAIIRHVSDREIVRLFTAKIEHQVTDSAFVRFVANPFMSVVWFILKRVIVW